MAADFEIELKRMTLMSLLEKAATALPTRELQSKQILKNFQMQASEQGLQVIATNLELSVVAATELVRVGQGGMAVFPGKRLLELVKEAEEGDVTIQVTDNVAEVEAGKTAWELHLMDASEYPPIPEVSKVRLKKVDRVNFMASINAVRYAAVTGSMRPQLMMIDIHDRKMRASDGLRFQQVVMPWWPEGLDLSIPIHAVDDLLRLLRDSSAEAIRVGSAPEHLVFGIGPDMFIASKLAAEFPPVEETVLKSAAQNDRRLVVDCPRLEEAVRRVRVAADAETSAVALLLRKDEMVVHTRDKYGNQAEESLDVQWAAPEMEVAFNHQHLLQMLHMVDRPQAEFRLGKDTKTRKFPLLIQDDDRGFTGLLNQLRIDFVQ